MEPITLATVTSAVVTLALEAAREVAPPIAKDTWTKVKGWLGWDDKTQAEDLATGVAAALNANAEAADKIVAELKARDVGAASRLVSKMSMRTENYTGENKAGRDINIAQGTRVDVGRMGG